MRWCVLTKLSHDHDADQNAADQHDRYVLVVGNSGVVVPELDAEDALFPPLICAAAQQQRKSAPSSSLLSNTEVPGARGRQK